jgi:hypothetical protein
MEREAVFMLRLGRWSEPYILISVYLGTPISIGKSR